MKTMSAKDAEACFDQFIDAAQQEPVVIAKESHPSGVSLSMGHLEDAVWGEKAEAAHADGYLAVEESAAVLDAEPPRISKRLFEQLRSLWVNRDGFR